MSACNPEQYINQGSQIQSNRAWLRELGRDVITEGIMWVLELSEAEERAGKNRDYTTRFIAKSDTALIIGRVVPPLNSGNQCSH